MRSMPYNISTIAARTAVLGQELNCGAHVSWRASIIPSLSLSVIRLRLRPRPQTQPRPPHRDSRPAVPLADPYRRGYFALHAF
jgi:hypothetical protein